MYTLCGEEIAKRQGRSERVEGGGNAVHLGVRNFRGDLYPLEGIWAWLRGGERSSNKGGGKDRYENTRDKKKNAQILRRVEKRKTVLNQGIQKKGETFETAAGRILWRR